MKTAIELIEKHKALSGSIKDTLAAGMFDKLAHAEKALLAAENLLGQLVTISIKQSRRLDTMQHQLNSRALELEPDDADDEPIGGIV